MSHLQQYSRSLKKILKELGLSINNGENQVYGDLQGTVSVRNDIINLDCLFLKIWWNLHTLEIK